LGGNIGGSKMKSKLVFMVLGLLLVLFSYSSAQVPQLMNYQGKLTDASGAPVNDTVQMVFSIYSDEGGVNQLWTETQTTVIIEKGVFNVLLGSETPIPYSVFDGSTRYLGVAIGGDPEITPRKAMVSVPYAFRAGSGGGTDNDWTFHVTDGNDTTLITGGAWGIARYGNILYGNTDSTHVNLGVVCTTGRSGYNIKYCTVGGGLGNTASHLYATIGGGKSNTASWEGATIGGGSNNTASGEYATVGGGLFNTASAQRATIGGGLSNTASHGHATIAGGMNNTTSEIYATVGGGLNNTASGGVSTIGGGGVNSASGGYATVGGGQGNTASSGNATVGGGYYNSASGYYATVGGGWENTAGGGYATIGGGASNSASGDFATITGGYGDTVAGDFSFASGSQVKLTSDADYTFAFGNNFTTSASHAVIFYDTDTIKVGIGTTSPTQPLDVAGTAQMTGFKMPTGADSGYVLTSDASGVGTWQTPKMIFGYNSGWVDIDPNQTITLYHNLGSNADDYIVYLDGKSSDGKIHQSNYGTTGYYTAGDTQKWLGCEWFGLTNTEIRVTRGEDDAGAGSSRDWDKFRIRIIKNQ
jgi:hypothetical protein